MKNKRTIDRRSFRLASLMAAIVFWTLAFFALLITFLILDKKIGLFITVGFALATFIALLVFAFRIHHENQAELDEAEQAIAEQLTALEKGTVRMGSKKWDSRAMSRLQSRVNDLIANLSSAANSTVLAKETSKKSKNVLGLEKFRSVILKEVRTSPHFRSALLLVRIEGQEPDDSSRKNLESLLRDLFPEATLGTYDERTLALCTPMAGSELSLKTSCEKIVSSYNDAYVDPVSSKLSVRRAKVSGAVYPATSLPQLIAVAEKEMAKDGDINICYANEISNVSTSAISDGEKRAKRLSLASSYQTALLEASSTAARSEAIREALVSFCSSFGFEVAGILTYDPSSLAYGVSVEACPSGERKGFSLLGESIDPTFIDPFYEASRADQSFFVNDVSTLPSLMANTLQSLEVRTFYCLALEASGQKLGLFYVMSSSPMGVLTLGLKESLALIGDIALNASIVASLTREADLQKDLLYALGAKSNRYVYMVNRNSMRITAIGQNLRKKFPEAVPGAVCHKVMFGLDAPCEDCPLQKGTIDKNVPEIAAAAVHASLVPFAGTSKEYATILFEKHNAAAFSDNNLFDPTTLVKNTKAFNLDLTRELRSEGHGFVFAMSFNNVDSLVKRIPGATIDGLLRIVAQQAQDAGYDELIYRNDDHTLSFLLRDYTKDQLYSFAEEIASLLSVNLPFESTFFTGEFSYSAISYPVEASTTSEMAGLIRSELQRSEAAGSGRISEVGLRTLRRALRRDYIEECLTDALRRAAVPYTLQPILGPENMQPVFIDALLHLEGMNHEVIHGSEFSPISAEKGLVAQLDTIGVVGIGKFYASYTDLLLRKAGLRGLAYYVHEQVMLHPDFKRSIHAALSQVHFAKNFGFLEFEASLLSTHFEKVEQDIADASDLSISFVAVNFDPEHCSAQKIADAGIKIVKTAPSLIKNAVLNESSASSFIKMMREFDSYGIQVIVSGVENEATKRFATDVGAYAIQGMYLAAPLNETGAVRYLTYGH